MPKHHKSLQPVQPAKKTRASNYVAPIICIAIGLIGSFAFLQVYSVQAILPALMFDFRLTEVQAGLLVGATVLGVALMSPIMGMLSDAIGRKKLIAVSLLALAVPTLLMSQVTNAWQMTLLRFLQGISVPGITVVTIAYVGEEYQESALTKLMAYYVSGTVLGGFMGRFLLGHLHEWMGWRNAFLVMGALTFTGGLWVSWVLPVSQHFVANPNFKAGIHILQSHLRNRSLLSACLLGTCVLFTLVGCFTFINLHLAEEPYQFDAGQLANVFSVYLLGVLITPLTSRLLHQFGSINSIVMAILASMGGVLITLFNPLWLVVLGLAIMSSGVFITQSATIRFIAMNVTEGRSLASGLYYACYYLGGSVGAWVCGVAYLYGQWQWVVMVLLILQIIALFIAKTLMKRAL